MLPRTAPVSSDNFAASLDGITAGTNGIQAMRPGNSLFRANFVHRRSGQGVTDHSTSGIPAQDPRSVPEPSTSHWPSIPRGGGDATSGQAGVFTVTGMGP